MEYFILKIHLLLWESFFIFISEKSGIIHPLHPLWNQVHLTFLALHPAVAILAVLAVVTPVPGQAVAVLLYCLAPVTVETSHPALPDNIDQYIGELNQLSLVVDHVTHSVTQSVTSI